MLYCIITAIIVRNIMHRAFGKGRHRQDQPRRVLITVHNIHNTVNLLSERLKLMANGALYVRIHTIH
ncbi:unnamed protein product [Arctogadus glacialis]